jgi:hypothetical protein
MILNAVYLANWKDLQTICNMQIHHNNICENKSCIPHEYEIGESIYICKSNIEQKLNPLKGLFIIYTNGSITIHRSSTVTEQINIHPASICSN